MNQQQVRTILGMIHVRVSELNEQQLEALIALVTVNKQERADARFDVAVYRVVDRTNRVNCIRLVRMVSGMGLKEGKDLVDLMFDSVPAEHVLAVNKTHKEVQSICNWLSPVFEVVVRERKTIEVA